MHVDLPFHFLEVLKRMIENHKVMPVSINLFSIPLCLEHLTFLIKRPGWFVTKIYSHFIFEEERFKKEFMLMNQRSRQATSNPVEKDFFKLLNNSNFGYDCRNNLGNRTFELVDD